MFFDENGNQIYDNQDSYEFTDMIRDIESRCDLAIETGGKKYKILNKIKNNEKSVRASETFIQRNVQQLAKHHENIAKLTPEIEDLKNDLLATTFENIKWIK